MQHVKMFALFLAAGVGIITAAPAFAFDPNYIISDEEMQDASTMTYDQIRAFLSQGFLGTYETVDVNGFYKNAAQIIYSTALEHGINPQVLLVTLQKEQSLVTDPEPTPSQLDWAMGYGVCDDCSVTDSTVARFQGFAKQVNSSALQFIEGYMTDIALTGKTAGRYGPGVSVVIDDVMVTPQNAATASLYAYTPHLHGNENFASIWNAWFGRDYPNGTLMQVPGEPGVWLMQSGYRRPITSASALHSRFNVDLIVPVSKTVLERFPVGRQINLPNYTLVKDEFGRIYLLVDDALRHIDTMETFRAIGFSEDEVVDITSHEVAQYDVGEPIASSTIFPQGRLLTLTTTGTIFYVENGTRHIVLERVVIDARFPGATLFPAEPLEVEQFREGTVLGMPDGALVKTGDNATVYVIADGMRRVIPSESVFTSYGYAWRNIVTISESILNLHPLGEPLHAALEDTVEAAGE